MNYKTHSLIFAPILTGFFCILSACSTLPQHSHRYDEAPKTPILSTAFPRLAAQTQAQLTGYYLLSNPDDALAARLALIDQAQSSLDIQYYIWHNDKIGNLLFYHLIQAANRGVHIRLLIDDNNAKSIEGTLLALVQHPNIEIKLFNPYRFRKYRQWDMLLDVKRINRRMHNKTVIADGQLSIIGGRNIGNEYFNVSEDFQFADIDILLAGKAHQKIAQSFNDYWQDDYAFEVRDIVNHRYHTLRYPQLVEQLNQFYKIQNLSEIQQHTTAFSQWLQHDLSLNWVKAKALIDPVEKVRNQANPDDYVYPNLIQNAVMPTQQLDIISAYFIPQKDGMKLLATLAQAGVNVRVLTNSFASNDVEFVHAFYSPYRKDLLSSGVELYEFLPVAQIENFMHIQQKTPKKSKTKMTQGGSSYASLHAKTYIIDYQQVFVGSMNLDPRSIIYNTELGVLLDSPQLAQNLHQDMSDLSLCAWQLKLNEQQKITWTLPQHPEMVRSKEPKIKWWQKAGLKVVSWLPIERFF